MKLEDIRKLIDAATPADKWDATEDGTNDGRFSYATGPWHDQTQGDTQDAYNDALFIAASRTLMPKLLAVAEALGTCKNWHAESCHIFHGSPCSCACKAVRDARSALEAD